MYYVIKPWENRLFRQCRRAWDFAARERQNLEATEPARVFEFDEAIHDAMDVYYFPGMWDWSRAIVRPLAVQAFVKSMHKQRTAYTARRELSDVQETAWDTKLELGKDMLQRYFEFAAKADQFTSVQVALLFDVTVPDPANPDTGLIMPDGRGIWYRVRIDTVVVDSHERAWLVEHRLVEHPLVEHRTAGETWPDLDHLLLDEQALTRAWAWEIGFLGTLEGTIHNELLMAPGASAATASEPAADPEIKVSALQGPGGLIKQESTEFFRRTTIPRSETELWRRGVDVALETRELADPGLRLYPNPSPENCSTCAYRRPCRAMSQGVDPAPILAADFHNRTAEDFEPGRLGSAWGYMPETPRSRDYRSPREEAG